MRKSISILLALCLLLAVLPAMVSSVQAAGTNGAEHSLQDCFYYDIDTKTLLEDTWTSAILLRLGGGNYILTDLAPHENLYTVFSVANDAETLYRAIESTSLGGGMYLYSASPDFGKSEGFYPVGTVSQGESVSVICFGDGGYKTVNAVATDLADDYITLEGVSGEIPVFLPVLNSNNEICAIYSGDGIAASLITDAETFYGNQTKPTATEPPTTKPPATEPPTTKPPATEPPATEPPATEPPATEPPATEPPATEPPATEPPATQPSEPATQEDRQPQAIKIATDLPSLEKLRKQAVVQSSTSNPGTIIIVICAVLTVALLATVVIARSRKKVTTNAGDMLDEAEEGTQLADAPEKELLWLVQRNGQKTPLSRNLTLGRAATNSMVIPNSSTCVSGRHCEILVQNGAAYLRDVGSTNGTFINGHRLTPGQPVQLQPGMKISLGGVNSPEVFLVTK